MVAAGFILLGLIAGALSGLVGVGGGVIIVPALVYLFSFSQKTAQGTTLALLVPPIGLIAAYAYYKVGAVNIRAALIIIVGFIIGTYLSSRYATGMHSGQLARIFGAFLLVVGLKMIISG